MENLINFTLLKYTGKSGYASEVNCIAFKSIDSASSNENIDCLNYPVYAPYLNDRSFSYENWIKFKLDLNPDIDYTLTSRGITFDEKCRDYCYDITYTKIKNIAIWINSVPVDGCLIKLGSTFDYVRPTNSLSEIAIEDIKTYYVDSKTFINTIKIPLLFNGVNEIEVNKLNGSICDQYFVFQQEVLKGLQYSLDYRPININLHYELQ